MEGHDSDAGKEAETFEFDCPDCGFHIKGETTKAGKYEESVDRLLEFKAEAKYV